MSKFVFDLDNTLIFTNELNNKSYNNALSKLGIEPILGVDRITRDIVFRKNDLEVEKKEKIIKYKQGYFVENIHLAIPNYILFEKLKSSDQNSCLLWTSASKMRVKALLEYFNIKDSFKHIFYSTKINIFKDVNKICGVFDCKLEDITFFEDCMLVVKELQRLDLKVRTPENLEY